ncbi:MAG: hypothetical protein AB4042_04335 [Leptolyngbyaceae cyanobacterium]
MGEWGSEAIAQDSGVLDDGPCSDRASQRTPESSTPEICTGFALDGGEGDRARFRGSR